MTDKKQKQTKKIEKQNLFSSPLKIRLFAVHMFSAKHPTFAQQQSNHIN